MRLWGRRVLAVDDDPDALDAIAEALRPAGAEVIGVGAPAYALPTVVFLMPDVLLVDVARTGEDGVSLVRRLRSLPAEQGGRIPAATISAAAATEAMLEEWRRAGFQRHVSKPLDPEELVRVVAELSGHAVERRRRGLPPDQWPPEARSDRRLRPAPRYQRGREARSDSASSPGSGRAK